MSAIASFYLISTNKLDALKSNAEIVTKKTLFGKKRIDSYYDFLRDNAIQLPDFDGSGYVFSNIFPFLEEKGIDLPDGEYASLMEDLSNKRECSHCIIAYKQRLKFINQLESADYTVSELQSFNEQFSGEGDEGYAMLAIEGIKILCENITKIENENQVLLLIIG